MAKVTKETLRKIYELYLAGEPVEEIAKEVGLNHNYVRSLITRMRKAGIPLPKRVRSYTVDRMIREFAEEIRKAA